MVNVWFFHISVRAVAIIAIVSVTIPPPEGEYR
jgi:hypothetical protein